MKLIVRILAPLFCIAVLLGCAACAGKSTAPAGTTALAGKVKITYSGWGTIEEHKTTQEAIDKFNANQSKIEVELMLIAWETYVAQLNTLAAANNLPDSAILLEQMVMPWAKQNMLVDVSGMYSGGDIPLDCITFKAGGKPIAYSTAAEVLLMFYNKDMFDKAGLAYPPSEISKAWTWDEFLAAARKLTLDKNGKHPGEAGFDAQNVKQYGCLVENLAWMLEWPVLSNGGGFYSADGSKVTIGEPAAIEAIQKVADLYLKEHVAPLSVGATDDGVKRGLIAGTVAMTTNGAWNVGTCLNTAKEQGLKYGAAVLPKMKKSATLATGGTNVVFKQSKHQAEAMEWLKWNANIDNSWGLISAGIWPPIFKKYYTDTALTKKWLENPNFPVYAEYKSSVVDVLINNDVTHSAAWFNVSNTADFNDLLKSVLGDVWTGKTTAQQAITANLDKFNAAFQGKK